MKFVSNRDIVVRSLTGHSIGFVKGVPTEAPKAIYKELMAQGILPVEDDGTPVSPSENTVTKEPDKIKLAPQDGIEYDERLLEAIKALVERNDAKSFTGGNRPNAQAVSLALGYKVDQKAINKVWELNRYDILTQKAA